MEQLNFMSEKTIQNLGIFEIFKFVLEIKFAHHFYVEFHGDSNGDSLEA